jgi:hypothetical protein
MAPEAFVYSLYHVECSTRGPSMLLVRVTRPSYRNASQAEEDWAYQEEDHQRARLLATYQIKCQASCGSDCTLTLRGICEGEPPGDILYEEHGQVTLALWLTATRFGHPWVLLGVAPTEDAFFTEVTTNTLYANYYPERPAQQVNVYFITEADEDSLRIADT